MSIEVLGIMRIYYIQSVLICCFSSLLSPLMVYYKGQLFIPEQLSWLFMISSIVGMFQFLMNKVSWRTSLMYTPYLIVISSIILVITAYYDIKYYILLSIIITPIVMMASAHYGGVIQEVLKNELEIQKVGNNIMSLTSIGSLIGLMLGRISMNYISYHTLLIVALILISLCESTDLIISRRIIKYKLQQQ